LAMLGYSCRRSAMIHHQSDWYIFCYFFQGSHIPEIKFTRKITKGLRIIVVEDRSVDARNFSVQHLMSIKRGEHWDIFFQRVRDRKG
jgi:hypothetical protein